MNTARTAFLICLFAIAMAALEAAVVVYLRALYYPHGFTIALNIADPSIIGVELLRELATIVMLLTVGAVSGRDIRERFAYFLLSFAVWDIFYYAWLKVFINWPASIMDWDILFLFPVTWIGPVAAPLVCSVTMLALAYVLLRHPGYIITREDWMCLFSGSMIILFSFTQDYLILLTKHRLWGHYFSLIGDENFLNLARNFVPNSFSWFLFGLGEFLLAITVLKIRRERTYGYRRLTN